VAKELVQPLRRAIELQVVEASRRERTVDRHASGISLPQVQEQQIEALDARHVSWSRDSRAILAAVGEGACGDRAAGRTREEE
jgi:hypothetical protein